MAQPSTEGPFPERRPESPVLQRRGFLCVPVLRIPSNLKTSPSFPCLTIGILSAC
jgi:hypothetical protein